MSERTSYALTDGVATIRMDDGKVNALNPAMLGELAAHFNAAENDGAEVVVLTGREQTFSAGFDLRVEVDGWPEMLLAGARVAHRMFTFPRPVVIACNGNALAMAGFLLLAADYRVGTAGEHKIGLNEVRIGMTIPWFGIELARHRLPPQWFDLSCVTGAILDPEQARTAGFLDRVVEADVLEDVTAEVAADLREVKSEAHLNTKLRVRGRALEELDKALALAEKGDLTNL